MSLLDLRSVTPGEEPSINDIIVCGACQIPSVVTLLSTRLLSIEETSELPAEVQADIRFALRALEAKLKQN